MSGTSAWLLIASIAIVGCRSDVEHRAIRACDDYATAFARCQNARVGRGAGTQQATVLQGFYRQRAIDAGVEDQERLCETCMRAYASLSRRCPNISKAQR